MNSTKLKELIRKNKDLFWYIPEHTKENLSPVVVTEFILNYGDLTAIKQLFDAVGINKVADIFYQQTHQKRSNYHKQVSNYFHLYFQKHVPQYHHQ